MDDNASAPLLSPEQAQQLQEMGAIQPETASSFFTTPEVAAIPVAPPANDLENEKAMLQQARDLTSPTAFSHAGFPTGITGASGDVTDSDALASLAGKKEQENLAAQQAEQDELARQEQVLAQYQQDKINAQAAGVALPSNPEAEALLNQQEIAAQQELNDSSPTDFVIPNSAPISPETVVGAAEGQLRNIAGQAEAAGVNVLNEANAAIDAVHAKSQEAQERAEATRMQREQDLQAKQQEMGAQLDETEAEYRDALENADATSKKTIFSDKGTGESILAGLAIFMSGFGTGLQGRGGNPVLDMLTKKLEQDTKNAQFKAEKLGQDVNRQQSLYDAYYDRFKDADQAYHATMASQYKDMQSKLSVIGQKFDNAQSAQRQQLAAQSLQQKYDEHRQAAVGNATLQHMISNSSKYTPQDFILNGGKDGERVSEKLVPGFGLAPTKSAAKELRELHSVSSIVDTSVDELLQIGDGGIGSDLNPATRARAETVSRKLKGALRLPIIGPGTVSETDQKILDAVVTNPTKLLSLSFAEKSALNTLKRVIKEDFNARLKTNGLSIPKTQPSTFRPEK